MPMSIFSPITINNVTFPNHFSLAPINTGHFYNGHMLKDFTEFHRQRSGKYIGATYVGNVAVNARMVTNPRTAYFSSINYHEWIQLAEIINLNGSIPAIQLGCRFSKIPAMRAWINKNPEEYIEQARKEIASFDKSELDAIMEDFLDAAKTAWKSGFKVIQIHAAHGYLFSLLANSLFNCRHDEYNSKDLTFLKRLIEKIAKELPNAILDIRISFFNGIQDREAELQAGFELLEKLVSTPIHIIGISNGIYNINKNYIYPPASVSEEEYIAFGTMLSNRYPTKYWNIAGNLHDISKLSRIKSSENLFFSFGRQLICDPYFISKYINNQEQDIIHCTYCGKCHYYSNHKESL